MLRSGDPVSLTSNPRVSLPGTLPRLLNALSARIMHAPSEDDRPGDVRSQSGCDIREAPAEADRRLRVRDARAS